MRMKITSTTKAYLALAAVLVLCSGVVSAQKLSKSFYEDHHNGYRFRAPNDWLVIPTQAGLLEQGLTCRMEGEGKVMSFSGKTFTVKPALTVLLLEYPELGQVPDTTPPDLVDEKQSELEEEYEEALERISIEGILLATVGSLRGIDIEDPKIDESFRTRNKLEGRHRAWVGPGRYFESYVDIYEFELEGAKLVLIYRIPDKLTKKWRNIFKASAKSVELVEVERTLAFEKGGTYEDILAYHEELTSRTPGWRVLPTPSERFLVKTSSENSQFVEEVIERLELSRDLFERDFPPTAPITNVSVVRICGTEEEFHSYGGTTSGVGGWFSPETAELVLFDYRETDRNATYAVMSHEAFHQYCFYLFDRSEAHRWFDEGHGDYYGGAKFSRGRAKITPKMPAGFDRLSVIKGMIQRDDQVPLEHHLNFNHGEWQNQGPTNVSCYAQSWSVIYMLRRGALGDVPRKLWKKEYASIIPNYIRVLQLGFREAYAEILAEREEEARFEGRELDEGGLDITTEDLGDGVKEKIWKAAIEASWGQIDLDEFEENWLTFVRKNL